MNDHRSPRAAWIAGTALLIANLVISACSSEEPEATRAEAAHYVGRETCASCHSTQHDEWVGSHHDLAMQEATAETVLGDFDDSTFTKDGVTSSFSRNGDRFVIRTDGPNGELTDYEVAYVFGVDPLQQYLIRFPGGRLQVLSICWDARPEQDGGQRWYHLYGDEPIDHTDELHWTGPRQNWNYMCADCHSTNLRKRYDPKTATYDTTWSEIDVSCEACHGPGSNHVAWTGGDVEGVANFGLTVALENDSSWVFDPGAVSAHRSEPRTNRAEIETCAPCHSRRSPILDHPVHGQSLSDTYRISLLDDGLYHADGQILDEVYVYGSFAQSRMYHQGVTCSDCHDPHTQKTYADDNALCARCHQPSAFDTKTHHMHEPGSIGASCVECHMPERTYMGVDDRRDHSIRIPRPDLSSKLGIPNACNRCHTDQSPDWAVSAIEQHFGDGYEPRPHYAPVIDAARRGRPDAGDGLAQLVGDPERPAIVRATAASLLQQYPGRRALETLAAALADESPAVRTAAVASLEDYPVQVLTQLVVPLLDDETLLVRSEVGRVLAAIPEERIPTELREQLRKARKEFLAVQLVNSDQPWAHVNIGLILAQQGDLDGAAAAYEEALRLAPIWSPAYVNLADARRQQGRDDLGEKTLRRGLENTRERASIRNALGLLLARTDRVDEALVEFEAASREQPEIARFSYTYAVALHSSDRVGEALTVLERTHGEHPFDRDVLAALAMFERDRGAIGQAVTWARKLVDLDPSDGAARRLLNDLEKSGR